MKLTQFFFKGLTGEPLDTIDLKAIDEYAAQAVNELVNAKKQYDKDTFNNNIT